MSGSRVSSKPPAWRRPKTKVYDYNYNLGEHYYKPHLRHMDNKSTNRAGSPPRAKTFAERFAEDPVYGNNSSEYGYRTTADRPFESVRSTPPPPRHSSLQDLRDDFGAGSTRRQPLFESRGLSPDLDDIRPNRPRLNFSDRLLDAIGAGSGGPRSSGIADNVGFGSGLSSALQDREDPFEDPFFQRRKLAPPRSADADFLSEDPFLKRRNELRNEMRNEMRNESSALALGSRAGLGDDEDFGDFKRDSENVVAGFRSRMQARRQREDESNSSQYESPAIESKIDKIRSRAKARLADLEDDLPHLSLAPRSSSLSRREHDRDLDSSSFSSNIGSSKTLKITKRTVRMESDYE